MNIKNKLPLVISLLVAIPLFLLSFIIYFYISGNLVDVSTKQLAQVSELQENSLASFLNAEEIQIIGMAEKNEVQDLIEASYDVNLDNNIMEKKVFRTSQILKKNTKVSSASEGYYIADKDGKVLAAGNKDLIGLNIKEREYFKRALNGELIISDFFISKIHKQYMTVIAMPVVDINGDIIGIIAKGLSREYVGSYIFDKNIGKSGYVYVTDSKGKIIFHPNSSKIGEEVKNNEVKNIIKRLGTGELLNSLDIRYKYNNTRKMAAVKITPKLNWIVVVTREINDMIRPAIISFFVIISMAIIFLIVAISIGRKYSDSIIKPLYKLKSNMKKAAGGDMSVYNNYTIDDEIGDLSSSFNSMIEILRSNYDELSALYEELSATEEELRAQYDELIESQELLESSEERYKLAIEGAKDIIWDWDLTTKVIVVSDRWNQISNYNLNGKVFNKELLTKIVHKDDISQLLDGYYKHFQGETSYFQLEFRAKLQDDKYIWVSNRGKILKDRSNRPIRAAGSITDITYRKKVEEDIKFMAFNDTLTQVSNRALFVKDVEEWIKNDSSNESKGALLFIDLDDFKNINDTLGHDFGDKVIIEVSKILKDVIGKNGKLYRFGGDEFIILQTKVSDYEECEWLAQKILDNFSKMIKIGDKTIYITVSVGVSFYPLDGKDATSLLKNSDTAMYKAKEKGKNLYEVYHKDMYLQLERKILIEQIIRNALINDEFQVYYQPKVDIKTGNLSGFEALIRLITKEHGFISPGEFIPVAEDTGLIVPMGMVVLEKVCEQIDKWKKINYDFGNIAVNVSTVQFQQKDFFAKVKETISKYNVNYCDIQLEITESILIKSLEESIKTLNEFKNIGIKISLDDFGTGYSSLTYLREIPAANIKIDKSFIDDMCSNKEKSALIDAIIFIAHKMGLKVIAEGVEKKEQLQLLINKDCDEVQGYIYSKPMSKNDAEELLSKGKVNYDIDKI